MADLSRGAADEVLHALFSGVMYVGLARTSAADEETDASYRRRRVLLSDPQGEDVRYVTNAEPIIFPAYAADASGEVRYAFLARDEQGTALWSDAVERPRLPLRGDIVIFPAGAFRIGVP